MENFGGLRVIFLLSYLVSHNLKFFGTIMNVTDRFAIEVLLHTLVDVRLEGTQPSAPVMHALMWSVRERKLLRVR